jgi:hypothetical protein
MMGGNRDGQDNTGIVYRMMDTNAAAALAISDVVAGAKREIRIFDTSATSLRERGFGSPERIGEIRQLLLANRQHRLRIVLHETRGMECELPRLINLLATLAPQIQIHRSTTAARDLHDVLLIADDVHCWRKPHCGHPRSIVTLNDPLATQPFLERFDEIWQHSELAVGGETSGL